MKKTKNTLRSIILKEISDLLNEEPKVKVSKRLDTTLTDLKTLQLQQQSLLKGWQQVKTAAPTDPKRVRVINALKELNKKIKAKQSELDAALKYEEDPELDSSDDLVTKFSDD